jgi:1-acyl-sn-glycerol-3-phosphate acyltransferase
LASASQVRISRLGAALKLVRLLLRTLGEWLLVLLALPLTLGSERRRLAWASRRCSSWGRGAGRILGMKVRVRGAPPDRPFFLVCNHMSYVDIWALAGVTGGLFVAKSEVARWPLMGFISRHASTLFVDRRRMRDLPRVMREIGGVLEAGQGVLLFAEGTSSAGDRVLPFRSPLLEVAARGGIPVSYAGLRYRTGPGMPPAGEAVCWWRDMTLADHLLALLRLPGFEAELVFGEEPLTGEERKDLALRLRRAVAGMLGLPQAAEDS